MKVVFMGTPDFAVPCLQALIDEKHDIAGVFCQPDRPKGRGQKLVFPPVKALAVNNGLPVFQPEKIKDGKALAILRDINPELIVVVAYGKILPADILNLPKYGCINVHASLLPKLRGAAPVQWAVLNGEKETGITVMQMDEGMDTGDILAAQRVSIGDKTTAGELFEQLSPIGAGLLAESVRQLEKGLLAAVKQDHSKATYAPMLSKSDSAIDWSCPAQSIYHKIRGLNPWPVAATAAGGVVIKVYGAEMAGRCPGQPGEVAETKDGLTVCCGDANGLRMTQLQRQGSRRMHAQEFLRGFKIEKGEILGK